MVLAGYIVVSGRICMLERYVTGKATAKGLIVVTLACLIIGAKPTLVVRCRSADEISSFEFIPENIRHRCQIWDTATALVFDPRVTASDTRRLTKARHCNRIDSFHFFELISYEKDNGRQKDSLSG
jgi:hypothetical protein